MISQQKRGARTDMLQQTSFEAAHLKKCYPNLDATTDIETFTISAVTVEQLSMEYYPEGFDLLAMDLEGYEKTVLLSMDLDVVRPAAIVFESDHLSPVDMELIRNRLKQYGYSTEEFGGDTFAKKVSQNNEM